MCAPSDMYYLLWFGHSDHGFNCSSRHGCAFSPVFTLASVGATRGPDSSVRIATRGTFGFRTLMGAIFSAAIRTGCEAYPSFCTIGTGSFRWANPPVRTVDSRRLLAPRLSVGEDTPSPQCLHGIRNLPLSTGLMTG